MGLITSKDDLPKPQIDLERYLGTWYEIARLPYFFERKAQCVTATYSLNPDGTVRVYNRSNFKNPDGKVKDIVGKAWAVDDSNSRLKVQFYWPIRADYWILKVDDNYQWAVVGHPNRQYFWILSRTPKMEEKLYGDLLDFAKENKFPIEKLEKPIQCEDDSRQQ